MAKVNNSDPTTATWHRWFRRTNVHTAEYIVMLVLFGALLGLLSGLWFSFFKLLLNDDFSARVLARATAVQLGSLLVFLPAAFWMYSRVTGQEGAQPELQQSKPRAVFLTLWTVGAILSLVGVAVGVANTLAQLIFGIGSSTSEQLVGVVIPGVLTLATLGFGIAAIVKRPNRSFVKIALISLAATALVLGIMNVIMVFVRKESGSEPRPTRPFSSNCTYARYRNRDCSYSEYLQYLRNNQDDDKKNSTGSSSTRSRLEDSLLDL